MPAWMMLIFGFVAICVMLLLHSYVWRRLVRDTGLPHPWRRVVTAIIIAFAISVPITLMGSRLVDAKIGLWLGWPVFVWLGFAILLLLGFLTVDLIRLARWSVRNGVAKVRKVEPSKDFDPERRKLFARAAGGAVVVAAAGTSVAGTHAALREQEIEEVSVSLSRLPRELDGFTIAQITDVHVGFTVSRSFVQGIVDRVNALKPDLVAITGDLVDGDVPTLRDAVAPLAELSATHGAFFVTGNHEYYSGADDWIAELRRLGITVLFNERVRIGSGEASFDLAGVTDLEGKRHDGHKPDLARALAGRDPSRELVLLAHQPRFAFQTKGHGVGLQLSGHTHGGQIWPWHYLVKIQQGGFLAGLQRHGDTQVYTSRGTGYWGPPLRVGAPSEITRLILRAEGHEKV